MGKPIEYVAELNEAEAKVFVKNILNPSPNPVRDQMITTAKSTKFTIR